MRSKIFVFFSFIFILCLVVVGWYFMEGYANKAPAAMAKGAESFVEADVNTTQKYQDFFSWVQTKINGIFVFINEKKTY